jgi:hypothetical protein
MKHPADRVPDLERKDLEVILALIDTVPEDEDIRILKRKVDESMSVYRWQDSLIEEARRKYGPKDTL